MDDLEEQYQPKWPLHPQPRPYETLTTWMWRIADVYGVSYRTFCRVGLGLSNDEIGRLWNDPPEAAIMQLARGTGVPQEQICQMSSSLIMSRLLKEFETFVLEQGPEYRQWLADRNNRTYPKTDEMLREERAWLEFCQPVVR